MSKPVLQAMVLADHVYQDRMTGKFIIAGTFSAIIRQNPPNLQTDSAGEILHPIPIGAMASAGSPYLYLALVEVIGQVPLILKFIDLADASLLFEANIIVGSTDPLLVAEYVIPMPQLPIAKSGNFSLDLLHDNEILGSWRVFSKIVDNPSNQSGEQS